MRSIMVLTSGTVIAQSIGYLITPILTRIYSTEEMGDLGIYMRAVGLLSTLLTARYELALPLPKNDAHSYLLYRVALRVTGLIFVCCSILGLVAFFALGMNTEQLVFLLLTLTGSCILAFSNSGLNWSIRTKQFKRISAYSISNALASNFLRWIFGILQWGGIGLVFATFVGYFMSSLNFVPEFLRTRKRYLRYDRTNQKSIALARQYRQFPAVSLPHALIDMGRDLIVALLIVQFFSKDVFGSFNHSYMVLRLPLVFIGVSIGQVFFNRCSEMINRKEDIYPLLRRTLLLLAALSVVPFGCILFFGEPIFEIVFGQNWGESGYYSQIMAIWLMMNFIHSPISNIPIILNRQKEYFIFGLISTAIQLIGFGCLPFLYGTSKSGFIDVLLIVSVLLAINQVVIILFSLYYAKIGLVKKR